MAKNLPVAVIDCETDPFSFGSVIQPFVWGFYDGEQFTHIWGENCTARFFEWIKALPGAYRIYIHNGGKFDLFFALEHIENPVKIINGRIVSCKIGKHTVVDSFAIIPESLKSANAKQEIDYDNFRAHLRGAHRAAIVEYLYYDCLYLYELCSAFVEEFGPRLTIGGTAMKELSKLHRRIDCGPTHDSKFRPYYYGGRVQCFDYGIIRGNFKLFDVNSMYPDVMARFEHPIGEEYWRARTIDEAINSGMPFFAAFEGRCKDLPMRDRKGNVRYHNETGLFAVTGHEVIAAIEIGSLQKIKNAEIWVCRDSENYGSFIDHFNQKKIAAEVAGDKIHRSFYKRVMNSGYGRFAIDPEKFCDYHVRRLGEKLPESFKDGAEPLFDYGSFEIWQKPSEIGNYQDVAIGASITGAARSVLMRALHKAQRPIYCDTDSIVCEDYDGELHQTRLGAWKLESDGIELAAIGGKKMYALFDGQNVCLKYASKGCKISPDQIKAVADGATITYNQDAPNFSLRGAPMYITRRIRSTR